MVKINWTELALDDLKNIHDFISKDSSFYADRFTNKLINRTDQLEKFPKSGRVVPEFEDENIRELIDGSYRIIYKISVDSVYIVRIHHSASILFK